MSKFQYVYQKLRPPAKLFLIRCHFWSFKNIKFLTILSFFLTIVPRIDIFSRRFTHKGTISGHKGPYTHTHTRTNESKFITCQ